MEISHLFRLLTLFAGISMDQMQVESWHITVPRVVTATEGSCVVVPCQTQIHVRVIWYQYQSIKYPVVCDNKKPQTVDPRFRGRTEVVGRATDGNCTLLIDNVKKDDHNLQLYVWINPDSPPSQQFQKKTVLILVEKRAPVISVQEHIVAGENFKANCSVISSCPVSAPSFHWNINTSSRATHTAYREKVYGHWMYTETLLESATHQMLNSKMRCSTKFHTTSMESQLLTLNVFFKPVAVTLVVGSQAITQGSNVTGKCSAEGNPRPHNYSWLRRETGNYTSVNSTNAEMLFQDISPKTTLSCIAYNTLGAGRSAWLDLDVQYAPKIRPESLCNLEGEVLKCVCRAEASPNASIYLTVNEHDFLLPSNNSNFIVDLASGTINSISTNQTIVSCTAKNHLGNDTVQLLVLSESSQGSSSQAWWLPFIFCPLMIGCAVFIDRQYFKNREPIHICRRCQNMFTVTRRNLPHLEQPTAEMNAEADDIYDNDLVDTFSAPLSTGQQSPAEDVASSVYLNEH